MAGNFSFTQPTQTSTFGQPVVQPSVFGGQSAFGQSSTFGQQPSSGLNFGQPAGGTTFSQQNTGSFGQSSGSSGFGSSASSTFGQSSGGTTFGQPAGGTTFGQQNTGTPFGQTTGASVFGQSSAFGQQTGTGGSAFGQQNTGTTFGQTTGTSAFGQPATSFGQPANTGLNFGQTATSGLSFGQPAGGLSFGQPKATTFGQTTGTSAFGQPATTFGQPANTGLSFGQPATSTGLSFGQPAGGLTFGQTGTTGQTTGTSAFGQPSTGLSFGQPATGGLSFGQPAGGLTFGQPNKGTTFGQTTGTSAFGQPATSFGQSTTGATWGSGGGAANFSFQPTSFGQQTSLFGQPQQQQQQLQLQLQQQQRPQIDEAQAFQQSVFQCSKFGDERDSNLAGLNYLQACWGAGKGFYSQTHPPTIYNQQNPFYRFKAVGYAFMYTDSNEDGQVVINFKKPQEKVNSEESNIVSGIQQMLNRPNILIRFTGTKAISEYATVAIIYAEDRNTLRRVPATDMAAALCQPHLKAQLENLGVTNVNPKVKPSPEQLKRYLENPPDGIDPRVWAQAQDDNPESCSMTPIPLIGVEALKRRIEWQEKETQQHHTRLKLIGENVATLLNRHSNMAAELQQMRRKHVILTHRLISIICRQELMRKQGTTLQPEEELIKKKLEEMDAELNSPTQYKGRLNELLSQIRLHKSSMDGRSSAKYNVDASTLMPVKDFLSIQQESVKHLVATTKSDFENLKEMMEELRKIANKVSS